MNTKRNVPIALPVTGEEEWQALREPLMSGWITQGPKVSEFEKTFAAMHNVKNAIAVTSCTTGLHLILSAMNIGEGDEVIVPAFTWVATANVVLYCGATPVFVDVSLESFNIDIDKISEKITSKTKAVIAVHLFGRCAEINRLREKIGSDIKIIEDAACAAGADLYGEKAGSIGDAASFSFHPRKSITTGEGGMVTTNDDALADTMIQMRNHGATISEEQRHRGPKPYLLPDFNMTGFNYRMTDLQGAVGLVQLSKLRRFIKERQDWANYYQSKLSSIEWLNTPTALKDSQHGWQSFVTYVDPDTAPLPRNKLMEKLQDMGIATRPGTHAVHMLSHIKNRFMIDEHDYPVARNCDKSSMAIPLHNRMTSDDFEYVVKALQNI